MSPQLEHFVKSYYTNAESKIDKLKVKIRKSKVENKKMITNLGPV